MRVIRKRALASVLLLAVILSLFVFPSSVLAFPANPGQDKAPAEIALTMTVAPDTSITINWTTIDTALTNPMVLVWESDQTESTAARFVATVKKRSVKASTILIGRKSVTVKNFYSSKITGLTPNTQYSYRCGVAGALSEIRSFRTAPGNNDKYTFIYVTDPQVIRYHSKAWQANLDIAKRMFPDARFIYIAGDFTDYPADEGAWESFFNQPGNAQYNKAFSGSLISELPVAAAMGNHDFSGNGSGGIYSHYAFAGQVKGVPVSYAFDYGAARMIILNSESDYLSTNNAARAAQTRFLRKEVAKAKTDGKWTIVGFHTAIYSGASHMSGLDAASIRKYWGPIFASLNVDAVLQGHDHVLSRGFVKANGSKADITKQISNREFFAVKPDNAPLYFVGNCASTRKFYAPDMSDRWIRPGDPVARNFGYLDIDSGLPSGFVSKTTGKVLNPGPCTNTVADARTPTFIAVTVSEGSIEFKTYMTLFNPITNAVVRETFLYDSLIVARPLIVAKPRQMRNYCLMHMMIS